MAKPTAYVQIEQIDAARNGTTFVAGYAWETNGETRRVFEEARDRFEVPFEYAAYLVDLYAAPGDLVGTFPTAEHRLPQPDPPRPGSVNPLANCVSRPC
jgi:hypothetical protein